MFRDTASPNMHFLKLPPGAFLLISIQQMSYDAGSGLRVPELTTARKMPFCQNSREFRAEFYGLWR